MKPTTTCTCINAASFQLVFFTEGKLFAFLPFLSFLKPVLHQKNQAF